MDIRQLINFRSPVGMVTTASLFLLLSPQARKMTRSAMVKGTATAMGWFDQIKKVPKKMLPKQRQENQLDPLMDPSSLLLYELRKITDLAEIVQKNQQEIAQLRKELDTKLSMLNQDNN